MTKMSKPLATEEEALRQREISDALLAKYGKKSEVVKMASGIVAERATIMSFFSDAKNGRRVAPQLLKSLQTFLVDGNRQFAYQMLCTLTGHRDMGGAREFVRKNLVGRYRYHRYFQEVGDPNLTYVHGDLVIDVANGVPVFSHRSHHFDEHDPFENEGVVFYSNSNLFFLGWRMNVLRLAIAVVPTDEGKEPFRGIVLSARNTSDDPFAARFAMTKIGNGLTNAFEDTSDFAPGQSIPKKHQVAKSQGELKFRQMWPDAFFFMLGFPR